MTATFTFVEGKLPSPDDVAIDVAALSAGAIAADALPGFTSPAGTVFTSTNWTDPSTSLKYLRANNEQYFLAVSASEWRDVEIPTWTRNGIVFARWDEDTGRAIYFHLNAESDTLDVGVVIGLTQGSANPKSNGTFVNLGDVTLSEVDGYDSDDTQGDVWTFGCSGVWVYVEFNGTEVLRFRQPWQNLPGKVAFQNATSSYGFRDISVGWLERASQYSVFPTMLDMRDFGLSSASTTGSISGSSADITVADASNFAAGDAVIVEIGGESGAGARGTVGVGGTWPALSYADDATMDGDTSKAQGIHAYAVDTKKVRISNGAGWDAWDGSLYYTNMAIPLAIRTTVASKAGSVLTLSATATASATNASVYRDNEPALNAIFGDLGGTIEQIVTANCTVRLPSGNFAIGQYLTVDASRTSWKVRGAGKNSTMLFSPKGTRSATLTLAANYSTARDLHLKGNARLAGYMIDGGANTLSTYPYGIHMTATGNEVRGCKATDIFMKAFGSAFATDPLVVDCEWYLTDGLARYIQWQVQFSDSWGPAATNVYGNSPVLTPGFEAFGCTNAVFTGCYGVNAAWSDNGSSGTIWDHGDQPHLFEDDAQLSELSWSHQNPLYNVNVNISDGGPLTMRNFNIVVEGPINDDDHIPTVVTINGGREDVVIEDGIITVPDFIEGGNSFGGIGVRNAGAGTIVRRVRFIGHSDYANLHGNIHTEGGSLTAVDNVMDHAATGAFVTSETGTTPNP